MIAEIRPGLTENRPIYETILHIYSDGALIETNLADLKELLAHKTLKIHKTNGKTFKECVNNLLDSFPELTSAKGILRYYEVAPDFDWQECEKAEIMLGDALTQGIYGWEPDFWTLFENKDLETTCRLTMIIAN